MKLTKKRKEFMCRTLAKNHALGALLDFENTDNAEFLDCYGVTKKFATDALASLVEFLGK